LLDHWIAESWRFGVLAAAGLVLGLLTDHVAAGLLLATSVFLARQLRNLYRLDQWLRSRAISEPEEIGGVWEEIFHGVYQMQRRNRGNKRRLANLLNRFRDATAAMPDGTVVFKESGEIEWFNSAASRLLNLHGRDIGQRIDNLFRHPDFLAYLSGGNYTQPLVLQSPEDKQVMLLIHVVPYGDHQRLLIARDITRIMRLEQVRRDFVANVSHELRTPLTVVMGFLETMADADDLDPRQWKRSIDLMRAQTTRMQLIVEQLLLLSRLETEPSNPRREAVAIPAMLAAIREEATVLSGDKRQMITLECDNDVWLAGNGEELRSALSNLVFNAVQYTPAEGKISMRWSADAQGAHFSVSDTGIGIPAHHIPRLTERFYRVDAGRSREVGGTGLGLAIVKHVLQRHDATLHIESVVNEGSTFRCDFPPALVVKKGTVLHE
jgi:two-component system phosphate regulon sensor histidine kinase PhoR